MTLAIVNVLPRAGDAEQDLRLVAALEARRPARAIALG